ncbi:MAG: hypothetical protein JXR05_06155 [Flavobacteriaceae bacterium]
MLQKAFVDRVKKELPKGKSLNEVVSRILDISYDAAHRRTSLKSKFSLEESILLARHFSISIDGLFGSVEDQFVSVQKTKQITNEDELQSYFENSYQSLVPLLDMKDGVLYYSAKDIPLFYTLIDDRLSHFKMYVWLKLLDRTYRDKSFEQFFPKLSTMQSAKKLGELYYNLPTVEIWDITTINSTLKQIHFYYKAGQMSAATAKELCQLLKDLLNQISRKVISRKHQFQLYYNELLLMNNNVLITTKHQQSLFVPYTMLSYYVTSDQRTCKEAKEYFEKQLKHSKLLNASGEKEQNSFYNKMMGKVEALLQLIQAENILDFE